MEPHDAKPEPWYKQPLHAIDPSVQLLTCHGFATCFDLLTCRSGVPVRANTVHPCATCCKCERLGAIEVLRAVQGDSNLKLPCNHTGRIRLHCRWGHMSCLAMLTAIE